MITPTNNQTKMNSLMRSESMSTSNAEVGRPKYDISGNVYAAPAAPAKKKIMAPPMRYDLRKADATIVYNHIKELTKDDQAASLYLAQIQHALYMPKSIVFGYIPAPPNAAITRQVIGVKGHFFKMTTAYCGIYFIWHDKTTNAFLFWGPSTFKTVKAMNSIYWRIVKYCEMAEEEHQWQQEQEQEQEQEQRQQEQEQQEQEQDDDDYADMPALISMGNTPDHEHPEQS